MATRIAVVNHKGGVGKTTLTHGLGSLLAEAGYSVLCVDADAQCNLTQLFFGERQLNRFLDLSDTTKGQTLWSVVRDGYGFRPGAFVSTAPSLFVTPGDVQIVRYEEQLAAAWADADRRTESAELLTRLGRRLQDAERRLHIDFVVFDTSPSLGALNRTIALESDFLVMPLGADGFSIRGLKTLGISLVEWMSQWDSISRFMPSDLQTRSGRPVLGGYVIDRLPTRSTGATRKTVAQLQRRIRTDFVGVVHKFDPRLVRGREIAFRLGSITESNDLVARADDHPLDWRKVVEPVRSQMLNVRDRLLRRMKAMR